MYLRDQRASGHREADTARDGMPESVTSGPSMEQLGEQAPRGGEESCHWADGDKIPSPADLPWHATGAGRRCLRSGDCTDDRRHRGSARTGPSAGGEQTTCQLPRAKNSRQPSDICHLPASCPRRRADARPDPADLRPRQCLVLLGVSYSSPLLFSPSAALLSDTMPPPPPASLPLGERLKALAQTLQYVCPGATAAWFCFILLTMQ